MTGPGWPVHAAILLATGLGIPVMAAANSTLGVRLGSPPAAAVILFAVALLVALGAFFLNGGVSRPVVGAAPAAFYFGGALVAAYVLAITWIAPRFGVGNAVFFVLLGQIVSAMATDHFGLFGGARSPADLKRLAGVALMVLGVYLARRPPA